MASIIAAIGAIPAIINAFFSIWNALRKLKADHSQNELNDEEAKRQAAIDQLKQAKSVEEIEKANEEITRNLP